ncbi:protein DEK [Eucyclogobius newberryi]|uniref:protein DEK n=1 Tax=Eucyclogobius newberryi TaxID=166745 RepID=UPI003B5BDBBC
MSDAAEEAMDSSAASAEESEHKPESSEKAMSSPDKSSLWGVGEIVQGKRAKKSVERLDIQAPKKTPKLSIGDGSGEKLGDLPRTLHQLNKIKTADLVPLHSLMFDRRGKSSLIKKNIRQFNGFPFDSDSEQFTKKRDKLQKNFTNTKLKLMCEVLDLEKKGTHSDLVDRIMAFLVSPKSSGKRVPMKKKKRSKKNLSGDDSKPKKSSKKRSSSKQKPSSTSSPKKSKSGSKSKAIVMDSSSDDEDEGEEKTTAAESDGSEAESDGSEAESDGSEAESDGSEAGSKAESEAESGDKREEEGQSEEEEEAALPKPKARVKKTTPAKKQKSLKKPVKKRSRKDETDSESESDEDEPQKKKSKPAAKTKKADSSSNRKTTSTTVDDSSDEDEPLSKMVKKTPSDEQLKETVQNLLKEADLEELTMKQICQKVFEAHSEHDLSSKKDFIKQTVKSLIT